MQASRTAGPVGSHPASVDVRSFDRPPIRHPPGRGPTPALIRHRASCVIRYDIPSRRPVIPDIVHASLGLGGGRWALCPSPGVPVQPYVLTAVPVGVRPRAAVM